MQSYSFYGGREGRTYHLVQHYDSVSQMVSQFQKGGSYTDVNYHEYVLIDTIVNKNQRSNVENGLIYRRGMNYTQPAATPVKIDDTESIQVTSGSTTRTVTVPKYYDYRVVWSGTTATVEWQGFNREKFIPAWKAYVENPGGGAEYVGQIVGPKGDTPQIDLLTWAEFEAATDTGTKVIKNKDYVTETDLVPGDTTDEIKIGYANILDRDGNITGGYLAFLFPYTMFEWHGYTVSPYGPDIVMVSSLPSSPAAGKEKSYYKIGSKYYLWDITSGTGKFVEEANPWTATNKGNGVWEYDHLTREQDKTRAHPFWEANDLFVPRGIHGKNVEDYGVHIEDNAGATTTPDNVARDADGNIKHTKADGVTPNNNYKVYYRTRDFNNTEEGEVSQEQYIGDFRVVDRITTNRIAAADLVLGTRGDKTNFSLGDRIDDNRLSAGLCLLCVEAKNSGAKGTAALPIDSNTAIGAVIQDGDLKWRIVTKTDQVEDLTTVHYTIGPDDSLIVRFLDRVQINEDGRLYVKYGDYVERQLIGEVQGITSITFDDNNNAGVRCFRIVYNTYKRDQAGNIVIDEDFTLDSSGRITRYPTTDAEGHNVQFLPEIKFISSIDWKIETGNVVVTYSDGTTQTIGNLKSLRRIYYDEQYNIVIEYNTKADGINYDKTVLNQFRNIRVNRIWIQNDGNLDLIKRYKVNYITGQVLRADGTKERDIIGDEAYLDTQPINDMEDMKLIGDCLCILWGDPTYRNNLTNFFNSQCKDGVTRRWENLGPILAGNHIQGQFASLTALRNAYPYGFGRTTSGAVDNATNNRQGWLATVDNSSGSNVSKILYAYDYAGNRGWYPVQNTSTEFIDPTGSCILDIQTTNNGDIIPSNGVKHASLQPNGLWFVVRG